MPVEPVALVLEEVEKVEEHIVEEEHIAEEVDYNLVVEMHIANPGLVT